MEVAMPPPKRRRVVFAVKESTPPLLLVTGAWKEVALPPPKKRLVAFAVEESTPLLLLATVACQVAEEEERQKKAAPLHRNVGSCCSSSDVADFAAKVEVGAAHSKGANEPAGRRCVLRIPLKKRMAAKAEPVEGTRPTDGSIVTTARTARSVVHILEEGETTAATGKRKGSGDLQASTAATKSHRLYKRLKTGTEPTQMGWVEKVMRMGGWNPWFVVKKQLSHSDLNTDLSRLPLPLSKDSDRSRGGAERLVYDLSDAELDAFWSKAGLPVTVLDRWGREYRGGVLRLWKSNSWIVINGGGIWPFAARCMGLKEGDVIEVFSFRVGTGEPVLVLIKSEAPIAVAEEGEEEEVVHDT